jgi:AcrR family transcriptional regulator
MYFIYLLYATKILWVTGKRPYRLGKRQAAVDETKRRIIEAATLEYAENGIEDTSMQAVARRADVAPGTVLYHYPTPDDLTEAVVETWIRDMEAPNPDAIDAVAPLEDRIASLVRELYGLYERSEQAYRIYQKSPRHRVLKRYEKWWYENANRMMAKAMGANALDTEAMQVTSVLVNPGFRGTLLMTGIAPERAEEIATRMILDWLSVG